MYFKVKTVFLFIDFWSGPWIQVFDTDTACEKIKIHFNGFQKRIIKINARLTQTLLMVSKCLQSLLVEIYRA